MKKWIALLLSAVLMLSLCACGASSSADQLLVGYGRVDITPDYPVSISGSATDYISEGVLDPIYFTCIALRKGEQTMLIATVDLVGSYSAYADMTMTAMSNATGVPEENIIINGTHTHSSVAASSPDKTGISQYQPMLVEWAAEAALAAVNDLAAAEVYYGSTTAEGHAFVRHYELSDGSYAGPNFGNFNAGTIVGHSVDADTTMQLIRFVRADKDKKDIVLMNFPAHATMTGGENMLSADYPGPTRQYIAENTDTLVAFFIAAAGNQVPSSRIPEENVSKDYQVYGEAMGRIAVEALNNNMTKQENVTLSFARRTFTGKSNKADLDRLPDAMAVEAIWAQVGGRGTSEGKAAAKQYGFDSVYEVTAILNRSKFAETRSMDLSVLSVGDVSFVFAPYEMFASNGAAIRETSPYPMTFIVTCSYDHAGYLPDTRGVEINCYEAQITKFEYGTAEKLVTEYVDMLTELKAQ